VRERLSEFEAGPIVAGCCILNPSPKRGGKHANRQTRKRRIIFGPAEELLCLIMLQYMPYFTIPIVEDFAQLAYQALE